MTSQLLQLLPAAIGNLVPVALGATTGEAPPDTIYALPLFIALTVASGAVLLAILAGCILRAPRNDDKAQTTSNPRFDTEQFMRESIEQLHSIARALQNTTAQARTIGLPASERHNEGRGYAAAGKEDTPAEALAQLAINMCKLSQLTSHMQDEMQELERKVRDPQPAYSDCTPNRHYLTVALGEELFAVNAQNIYGVVEATQLVAEPSTPPRIRQAIRLHGALVPVIDLGARFGWQPSVLDRHSRIVILEVHSTNRLQLIGIVVDAVGKLLELRPTDIVPPAASDSRIRDDFTLGMAAVDSRPVILLDIDRGFSAHELSVLRSKTHSAAQENAPA